MVLGPTVNKVHLNRTLIDGGSCLDMIFLETLTELGLTIDDLKPSDSPFQGVIPGKVAMPLGQVTLPVTFDTRENYKTEHITF